MRKVLFIASILIAAASAHSTAQHQLIPVAQMRGEPALELQLRKLDTVGNFMMTTAHPDDENNAMLAYFSHGKGYRTSLVTATHGEGGQNEIGPELFVPLAVLRTEELLAAHRFDGADQYFTRAIDFNARARAFAAAHGLPLVGNGDIHRLEQLDTTYSLVDANRDAADICAAVIAGRVRVEAQPLTMTKAVRIMTDLVVTSVVPRRNSRRSPDTPALSGS